jgi:hypothetical protein
MKRTTITLPEDLAELLDAEARRRDTSVSEVVRQCIVISLTGAPDRPRALPFAALFDDPEMVPAERMDELLKAKWPDDLDRDRG